MMLCALLESPDTRLVCVGLAWLDRDLFLNRDSIMFRLDISTARRCLVCISDGCWLNRLNCM